MTAPLRRPVQRASQFAGMLPSNRLWWYKNTNQYRPLFEVPMRNRPVLPDSAFSTALPVLNYSTGAGWHSWGQAKSVQAARRIVTANLPANARSMLQYGFEVKVFRRTELQRELNGGPDGYVWSLGK
ncbi:hypothetical protein KTD31_00400 [Burkholderia multivorans]|uniref:hypothetical protein n=1 Tax=Burkholderia multivorans TaxID=87883 RepID=UPI001C2226C7|nr:hypothetical protein [Burkholderia multivorans]MBU9199859.1 hypothetical protein [Burkholderia multivorans]MDN8079022.1 hypothetical protein [Burkholderia multivorans]